MMGNELFRQITEKATLSESANHKKSFDRYLNLSSNLSAASYYIFKAAAKTDSNPYKNIK